MQLKDYLKRAGLVTGPSRKLTRHTHLGVIKSFLMGNGTKIKASKGEKKTYQAFGTVLHELFLLKKLSKLGKKLHKELSDKDKKLIKGMLESLNKHPVVQELMKKVVCEKTRRIKMGGVRLQYTPDAVKEKKIGIDLKTTVCNNFGSFIYAAFGYGYYRQGATYSRAANLTDFFIIGIQKAYPYKVMVVHISTHKDKMEYANNELDFLLYFYKNYGDFIR